MIIYYENLYHAQELQKWAHNKGVKPWRYTPSNKVWLNAKYIKTKCNWKLEAKFFGPFQLFYLVGKQAYKLELPRKWKIHDVFYISLLEQDIIRKERVNENNVAELDTGDNEGREYKVKAIRDEAIYAKKSKLSHIPRFYYLVSEKGYPEEENTWEPTLAV